MTYTGTGSTRFIRGDGAAIQTGEGADVLSNYGTIIGNTGRAISMEGGDDTLNLYGGSTVAGRIDGGVGADTLNLFGPGTGTLSNVINFELLNVQGGVWTVTDAQSYQAGATIGSGATLLVNGSLGNAVTVNAGGTLGGNGSVGNVLVDGGTLSPGNSIGTLTVQGSLTFTAASTYLVEVSAAASDRTNVTGAATLGGATVNASFTGTTFQKQYTILNAAGGVSGSFAGPVNSNLPSNLISSLSYDANNVYLNLALNFAATGKLSGNQAAVGNAITNSFNSTGSVPAAFGALTPAGLTQASGELGTGSQQTTFDAMNMFLGVMTDPFTEGRGGMSANGGASQFAGDTMSYASTGMSRAMAARDAYAAIYRKALPPPQTFEQRWSVWAAGFGGGQSTDGGTAVGSNSTTSRIFGVAVGADYRISPDTIAGLALAGGGTNFTVANALGGGRSDLFQTGAFIRHGFGPAYLLGALAYGWQDVTTDRTVTIAGIDRLRAQFNANALSGRIEGGYRFITPWSLALTPYAAGQFTTYDLPSCAEQVLSGSSAFAVAYGAKTVTATRSEFGVRSDRSIALQDGILSLRGRLAWAHDYNTDRSVAATFQTLPGASFVVNGAAPASDAVLTTASAAMNWTSGWSAALTFEGEFSDVTSSYGGKGVVRYTW
ncbi:autotransporter domain-containing protein [Bradyrhizobium elkanii]|uniref:autotransporter domain-containing protein n=1 Tax=Bradyrhizobium elkanii TaxID=29448 RepID=UPI003512D043